MGLERVFHGVGTELELRGERKEKIEANDVAMFQPLPTNPPLALRMYVFVFRGHPQEYTVYFSAVLPLVA